MNGITLNGTYYSTKNIHAYAQEKLANTLPEWQVELYRFLLQWFNPNTDTISVLTSGSTGPRKETQLQKEVMIKSARLTNAFLRLNSECNALLCLPTKYIGGKMMLVRAIEGNYPIQTVPPSSSPLSTHNGKPIHFCAMTPMQAAQSLTDFPERFEAIDQIILGGGAISNTLLDRLKPCKNQVYQTFGMTETVSHIALRRLTPNFEKHYHTLQGITVSQDQRNCLQIHAPELGHKTLVTNDLTDVKNETSFSWLGRWDDIINSGGIKVNPLQMEEKLAHLIKHRFIVSYQPHPSLGQELILIVESSPWADNETASLLEKVKTTGEKPRPKHLYFMASFPETETGKIQRKTLREACWRHFSLDRGK